MDPLHELTELFRKFPGIGPRQAKRFTYFLINETESYRNRLTKAINESAKLVAHCTSCFRLFPKKHDQATLCSICSNAHRDQDTLLVVSRDVDLETIEKSRAYNGEYFVLGGTVPLLEDDPYQHIRLKDLVRKIENLGENLKEIILALNLNAEGENTERVLRLHLAPVIENKQIKLSTFGRGLSTGAELEYADSETIGFALKGRI
jgi:recombination protein RecR